MSDKEIIGLIRKREHSASVQKLYDHFPKIKSLIRLKGGSNDDARDVFQESLVIFCKKAADPAFELTSSIGTYLYSICWHLWKDALEKRKRNVPAEWEEVDHATSADAQEYLAKEEKFAHIDAVLTTIGDKCRQIFQLYYFQKQSMVAIAQQMGFGSEQTAKNQKFKCLERAKELAKQMVSIH